VLGPSRPGRGRHVVGAAMVCDHGRQR
jgi:hypothetical protein